MKNTPPQSSINATQGLLQVRPLTVFIEILYEIPIPYFVKWLSQEAGLIVLKVMECMVYSGYFCSISCCAWGFFANNHFSASETH